MPLTDAQIARYARQLLVPGLGEAAQERLLSARVRVVGLGATSSAGLVCLVQAGVGRLWLEDAGEVTAADLEGWLYSPTEVGLPRAEAALAALAPLSGFARVEQYPTGGVPTGTLVCGVPVAQALGAAEAARRAGVPLVVVEPDADGGAVVTVPPGAPCYACARSIAGAGRPAEPATAALSALAAHELLQLIAAPGSLPGRRIELVRGVATARPTVRLAGCVCGGVGPAAGA